MAEDQAISHQAACAKAMRRFGGELRKPDIPEPAEIDAELIAYQSLFRHRARDRWLRAQREAALSAMAFFEAFSPRLTGAVLRGASTDNSPVVLHLFADTEEAVALHLLERGIPQRQLSRRYRWPDGSEREVPVHRVEADGQPFELVVFQRRELSRPPLSRLTARPIERADQAAVRRLLETEGMAPG